MKNPFHRQPDTPNNDALLKAIVAVAAQGTPEAQRAMYTAILNSTLLLAEDPEASPRPIMFVNKDDEVVLPVFSDTERLRKVCPDAIKVGRMPMRDLCRLALQNEIHIININPEQGPGLYLMRAELEALAQGRIPDPALPTPDPLAAPTLVPFGNPKLPSEEVLDKMMDTASELLSREPAVDEAHIMLLGSDNDKSSLAIGLWFRDKTHDAMKSDISQRLIPRLEAVVKQPMQVIWLTAEDLKTVRSFQEPFYKRDQS